MLLLRYSTPLMTVFLSCLPMVILVLLQELSVQSTEEQGGCYTQCYAEYNIGHDTQEGTGRIVMWTSMGIMNSYTMEVRQYMHV